MEDYIKDIAVLHAMAEVMQEEGLLQSGLTLAATADSLKAEIERLRAVAEAARTHHQFCSQGDDALAAALDPKTIAGVADDLHKPVGDYYAMKLLEKSALAPCRCEHSSSDHGMFGCLVGTGDPGHGAQCPCEARRV